MTANACKVVVAELRRAAVYDFEFVRGAKHEQVRWRVNGHEPRFITIPGSPSDWRWEQNLRSDIRRLLRADGLLVDPEPAEKPRPKPKDRLSRLEQTVRALEERLTRMEGIASKTAPTN